MEFQCEVVERLGNNTYLFGQCYGHDNVKILLPAMCTSARGRKSTSPLTTASVWFSMKTICGSAPILLRQMLIKKHLAVMITL
ncbi:Uncharacterised protein [Raoultella planticola]|uniref:Uncharacterized protein n=1 Tax=Raoultella planticola TaxID=575 RepID=A0A485DAC4_RAOPL|nr:Uncharacterised protein [Raoultella planticola]